MNVSVTAPPSAEPVTMGAWSARRRTLILVVALLLTALGLVAEPGLVQISAIAASVTLLLAFLFLDLSLRLQRQGQRRLLRQVASLVEADLVPRLITNELGQVLWRNSAADDRFAGGVANALIELVGHAYAHPAAVAKRLQAKAAELGSAREDVASRRGVFRVAVHRVRAGIYLWRFDEFADRAQAARSPEGISLPMLVAGRGEVILCANDALRRLLGSRPRSLSAVFPHGLPPSGARVEVAGAQGAIQAVLLQIEGSAERREIYLLPTESLPADSGLDLVQDLPVALMRLAANGAVLAINRAAADMLQLALDRPVNASDLFDGLGRPVRDWVSDIAHRRVPGRPEVLRLSRPGSEVYVQMTLRPLGDGARDGVLAVLADATAMKTLEAQFVQSQKMQAIGQLAGGVAHDFNNLLTAISGHCDLLLLNRDPTDPDYADLTEIHKNTNRAAALVGQLLAFSRKQTLRPALLSVNETVEDVASLLRRLLAEKVRLELDLQDGVAAIRADRRQLEQVLVNLVVNARDAMPEGGTIRLETRALHLDAPRQLGRALVPAGDYALVRVIDRGTGIPPELQDKIFEPFFTTKRPGEGTGLGLSMVYGIVKQSGGYVFFESVPARGTVFSLYFPGHGPVATEPPRDTGRLALAPAHPGVVLLVEDEAPVRAFAVRALRLRGHTVIEADCGEAALDLLEDPALHVDVVVTDVIMPGIDGPTWVREALAARPEMRIIFMSGYAEDAFAGAREDLEGSCFMPKPFSLEELTKLVQQQMDIASALAENPMIERKIL